MSAATTQGNPVNVMHDWLLDGGAGPLKPIDVAALFGEDSDGRDAWFFHLTFPTPEGDTWDPDEFAALHRAFRDKALLVGLPYPWYIVPHIPAVDDQLPEDDQDLPDP